MAFCSLKLGALSAPQCHKEFERLEVKKASKTCHTIRVKYDDYLKLVAEAHLEDQGVGALVQALQGGPGKDGPMAYVQKVSMPVWNSLASDCFGWVVVLSFPLAASPMCGNCTGWRDVSTCAARH